MTTAQFKQQAARRRTPEEERKRVAAVHAFIGKYRDRLRSSEEFAQSKLREIEHEDCHR